MQIPESADAGAVVPKGYVPYSNVDLCGNRLINVSIWVRFQAHIPVLVGKGDRGPQVWLSVPVPSASDWHEVVVGNLVVMPAVPPFGSVSVTTEKEGREIEVGVGGFPVLKCAQIGDDELVASFIDLTPLRLGIKGNMQSGLHIGGTHMLNNTFSNVHTAFGVG